MKNNIFIQICAVLLSVSLILSGITSLQIISVLATDTDSTEAEGLLSPAPADPDPYIPDPDPDPVPAPQELTTEIDPFDYNLSCYPTNIDFGRIFEHAPSDPKPFTVTNIGVNEFPLTWDIFDPSNAFEIYGPEDRDLSVGESGSFAVFPDYDLAPGVYTAKIVFYSANDIRQTHTASLSLSVTVEAEKPYVDYVTVSPGSLSLPVGKSCQFNATVSGGNNFDPSVTWSVYGNTSQGTKISDGYLTVASDEASNTISVVATSNQDSSVYDSAIVSLSRVDYAVVVKADPLEGGAVAGGGSFKSGSNVTISASPNNNYRFAGWYSGGALLSDSKQYTLNNVSSDLNLVAKFERATCYVKTGVNDSKGGTISASSSVQYNGNYTITAKANSGYTFEGFVENNKTISTASSIQLNNITSDRSITAVFKKATYNVNVTVNPQDTGKYEGAGKYNKDSKVKLTASAYDGYQFTGWSINGQIVSTNSEYVIEHIGSDVNIVANFMKKEATTYKLVSGITNEGGAIVPSGNYTAPEGSSVTYNIIPNAEYKITAVTIDGKNIGAVSSYTFNNIKGGHSITATFEKIPAQSATTTPGSTNKTTVGSKTQNQTPKVEYNEETAAKGAIPEQNVVNETPSAVVEDLDAEEYQEDSYSIATDAAPINDGSTPVGIMAKYSLDEPTVAQLIHDKAALPLLKEAFEEGYLQITVNNNMAQDEQETSVELYHPDPTLLNFENVIAETLTEEEQMAVIKGTPISFNIDVTENTDTVSSQTRELIQKKVGYRPISYFDMQIMKTSDGVTSVISTTNSELEVKVPIPEQFQKEGRRFYAIREHNGTVDVLQDIGNDPTSITFRTDRFSEYAIAYETVSVNKLILQFVIISLITLILAVICFAALVRYRRIQRKQRRAALRR